MPDAAAGDPGLMRGRLVKGLRPVPVETLGDEVLKGESLHEFREGFRMIQLELAMGDLEDGNEVRLARG